MNHLERLPTRSIAVLGFAILAFAPGTSAAERWVEVRSPNFVVVSNASEGTARHCAWQFEQMRAALAKLWPWARFGSASSTLIAAVKDESSLKKLVPQYWEQKDGMRPVSVWVDGRDRHYLMLRTDEKVRDDISVNPYFNAFRAYVHVVLDASLERPLPLWLGEALSEHYGNLAVRDKDLVVGRVIPWHVEEIKRGERLRLAELLSADRRSPLYTQNDRRQLLDAESWAFFHFLSYAQKGKCQPLLKKYAALSLQGQEAAAREAFDPRSRRRGMSKGCCRTCARSRSRLGSLTRKPPSWAARTTTRSIAVHSSPGRPMQATTFSCGSPRTWSAR